jgi:hypothetical protein
LPARCFLKGPKRWKLLVLPLPTRLVTDYGDMASYTSISCPLISICLGPLRSTWLVSGLWQMLTWSRLSLPHHNTWYWFLLYCNTSLVPWWDKCLNVIGRNYCINVHRNTTVVLRQIFLH